jgi:hypothetical protein
LTYKGFHSVGELCLETKRTKRICTGSLEDLPVLCGNGENDDVNDENDDVNDENDENDDGWYAEWLAECQE